MSSYVLSWMNRDPQRFPRAQTSAGKSLEMLSALSETNLQTDIHAFTALMTHLRYVRSEDQTWINGKA
jgi:hypothetical protein